jgi:hypothetical protein
VTLSVLSFGGGVNSTALLIGLAERDAMPDIIVFSDTGGEFPHTYEHCEAVDAWLGARGRRLERVTNADPEGERHGHASLYDECITNRTLPSLAFGFKGCSAKWKRQPIDRMLRADARVQAAWARGEKVTRYIGIDAGEAHRSATLEETEDKRWVYRRPLVDWGWDRDECIAAIERAGLEVPQKSACWYCPASRKSEVVDLAAKHPALFEAAVAMELNAADSLARVRGLGRHWSWESLVVADRAQMRLDFPDTVETPCGCYDGEPEGEE